MLSPNVDVLATEFALAIFTSVTCVGCHRMNCGLINIPNEQSLAGRKQHICFCGDTHRSKTSHCLHIHDKGA